MECIYRRFDPAFWAVPVIAVIIIVAVFFVIVLFSLKERKKQAQNWFVYLFAMILPSFPTGSSYYWSIRIGSNAKSLYSIVKDKV